jgi:protein arginine N-methyltransferase 1
VYPDVASMHVVGISDPAYRADRVNYWNDVYGFKMTVMSENVVKEALVDVMDDTNIITNIADLHSIDINTVTVEQLDRIVCPFELTVSSEVTEPIRLDALIVYFDIHFKALALNPVYFSTGMPFPPLYDNNTHVLMYNVGFRFVGPKATPTHWKQTVLLLKDVINVAQGDVVKGEIAFSMNRASFRDLDVILNYHIVGKPEQYNQNLFVST